jgi:hypothetical protein
MQLQKSGPIAVQCKLCAAFAASQLPTASERGLVGAETFTRDPDICDACLTEDYSARRRWGSLEQRFAVWFGLWIALLPAGRMTVSHRHDVLKYLTFLPPVGRMLVGFLFFTVVVVIPCALVAWLMIHAVFWFGKWRVRAAIRKERAENAPIDAERFYWLAVWGSLTGHERYKRRMLRRAKALNFADVRRIGDVT